MPGLSVKEIGDYIREQRRSAKVSIRQLAQLAGVSNPYLSQIERGLRKPSAEVLQQIAKALRISAEALYVQAGILDEHEGSQDVFTAIHADPELTERQKQVLLEIYESFRKENTLRAPSQRSDTTHDTDREDHTGEPARATATTGSEEEGNHADHHE